MKIPSELLPASSGAQYIQYDSTNGITSRNPANLLAALKALSLGQSILAPYIDNGGFAYSHLRGLCITYMGTSPSTGNRLYSTGGGVYKERMTGGPGYENLLLSHIETTDTEIQFWLAEDGVYGNNEYVSMSTSAFTDTTVICVPEGISF